MIMYVSDANNQRIQLFNGSGFYNTTIGVTGESCSDNAHFNSDNDHLNGPRGVAVDASRIYVADSVNHRVQVSDGRGVYITTIGGEWGSQDYQFREPHGLDVDAEGNVFISDLYNHRVQKYAPGESIFLPVVGRNYP